MTVELLEALEDLIAQAKDYACEHDDLGCDCPGTIDLQTARDAVTKARGES